jgi:hypothetical protein
MVWLQVDGSYGSRIKAALSGRLREIIVDECSFHPQDNPRQSKTIQDNPRQSKTIQDNPRQHKMETAVATPGVRARRIAHK